MKTKIPSPSRSQGAHTPRRKSRRTLSVGSPALSTASGRLTSVVQGFVNKQMDSFALSPLPKRRSVLTDNTDIMEEPRRKSWWKNLDENSRNVLDILEDNNIDEPNNIMEELDIEILSQEKKNYTLDIPESSDGESIHSIVLPQRKLFTQKETQHQKKFDQIIGTRETMKKSDKNMTINDKVVLAGTKELFRNKPKSKLLFPAALLDITPDKTIVDKTKEFAAEPKTQPRSIFGNRQGAKRKNMFADFIATESEEEISEIEPRVFEFPQKPELVRQASSASRDIRKSFATSNITTDTEMDEWRLLPSSTMVEHQLEAMVEQNTPKRPRLSKLTETKESSGTHTVFSKSESPEVNISVLTRSRLRANSSGTSTAGRKNKTHEKIDQNQSKKKNQHDQSQNNKSRNKMNESNKSLKHKEDQNVRNSDISQEKLNKFKGKPNKSLQKKNVSLIIGSEQDEDKNQEVVDGIQTEYVALEANQSQGQVDEVQDQQYDKNAKVLNNKHKIIAESQEIDESEEGAEQDKDKSQDYESENEANESQVAEEIVEEELEEDLDGSIEQEDEDQAADQNQVNNLSQMDENDEEVDQTANNINESNKAANESNEIADQSQDKEVDESNQTADENYEEVNQTQEEVNQSNEIANQSKGEDKGVEHDESNQVDDENNEAVDQTHEDLDKSNIEQNESQEDEENEAVENKNDTVKEENEVQNKSQQDQENGTVEEENEVQNESQEDDENETVEEENEVQNESQEDDENETVEEENEVQNESQEDDENETVEEENEVQNESQEDDENETVEEENEVQNESQEDDENETVKEENEAQNESQLAVEDNETETDEHNENTEEEANECNVEHNESQEDDENEAVEYENQDEDEADDNDNESENAELHYESASEEMDVDDEPQSDQDDTPIDQEDNADTPEPANHESNLSHDTTGRNRHKHTPEAVLHDETKQTDSFSARRNTSIRKTKSVINLLNDKPSLMPAQDNTGFSDGTTNSSAEGSGWDSHRTTRKTIRKTLGRDATPRKSLRALVMEKSAKRHTLVPLANSTAVPEISLGYLDIQPVHQESTHEVSLRTRQLTLDAVLEKIKEDNLKKKAEIQERVKKSFETHTDNHIFKVPLRPMFPKRRANQENKTSKVKPMWQGLPEEMIEALQYKPPKRFKPSNAPWITKRLYKYLETKLEPKYDYKARVRAEKLVETVYNFTKDLRRQQVASEDATNVLKHEMARLKIVRTHHDFYEFFRLFMPKEVRIKVIPDVVNKVPLPRCDVFSDIIVTDTAQG